MITTLVCDIQRFSIHDGPGVRTTIFFKGCPLRCKWCQNPETLKFENELVFAAEKCIACGECAKACPHGAITFKKVPILDRSKCQASFACTEVCPSRALEPAAKEYVPSELVAEVVKDREFYEPEGGVTLSGGEPLTRPKFLLELLPRLKDEDIHIAVQTCGQFNWEASRQVLDMIDLVLYDIKAATPGLHENLTGVSNSLILENLKRIKGKGIPLEIRLPLIPGMNDADDELERIVELLIKLGEKELWLLPYHRMGESKLNKLESELKPLGLDSMKPDQLLSKAQVFIRSGIHVKSHVLKFDE